MNTFVNESERAELARATGSPIRHLYFFDDLSFHIKRIADERGDDPQQTARVLRESWSIVLAAFGCLDHGHQDFNLVNWEHACAQLSFVLKTQERTFDVLVSQGCNGQYALEDLNRRHLEHYGHVAAVEIPNVRLAHILEDPSDPFYSQFTLGVSKGKPLDEQCADVAELITGMHQRTRSRIRVGIFDDCMGTGQGSEAVADKVIERLGDDVPFEMHMVAFVGNEETMYRLQGRGWPPWVGVLFRGRSYPNAWDWDIYFLKDQILGNAIRYADGSSEPYLAGGWYDKIFPADPEGATRHFERLRTYLDDEGMLAPLEAM